MSFSLQRMVIGSSAKVKAIGVVLALPALFACRASVGPGSDPTVGIGGAAMIPDPGPDARSRAQNRLRAALLELFRAEERYHADTGTYTDELYYLRGDGGGPLEPGPEVRLRIPEATEDGFSATARRASLECALYVGNAAPPTTYVREPGVVRCQP